MSTTLPERLASLSRQQQLWGLLALAFCARLVFIFGYVDLSSDNYWEYGDIAKNIYNGKGFTFFRANGYGLLSEYFPGVPTYPSAYLPPGYVLFITPFLAIDDVVFRNVLILLLQNLISVANVWLLYQLTSNLFNDKVAIFTALAAAVLPEFIYATASYTPTVLYHFCVLLLFLAITQIQQGGWRIPAICLLLSVLMYLRSEFVLVALLLLLVLFLRWSKPKTILIGLLAFGSLLPWAYRNYVVFDAFVPLTTNAGLNLHRGHNAKGIGEYSVVEIVKPIRQSGEQPFEIVMNREYMQSALTFIRENPRQELANSALKVVWFFSYIPYYELSGNFFYLAPTVLIMLLLCYGLLTDRSWNKYWPYYLFFASFLAIVVIFFPLPRYQTMMKILALPFAINAGVHLYYQWRNRPKKQQTV